jgi:hypothetical protein
MQFIVNRSPSTVLIRAAIICVALGSLHACTPRDPAVVDETEKPPAVEKSLSPVEHIPISATPVTSKPLDLSRENIEAIVAESIDEPLKKATSAMPDLFSENEQDKKLSVSGRVLTSDEAVSLIDSVEGAEIKLELKTQ